MKTIFFHGAGKRERELGRAFVKGAKAIHIPAEAREVKSHEEILNSGAELAAISGMDAVTYGKTAHEFFTENLAAGIQTMFFDKGYFRQTKRHNDVRMMEYWRIAMNSNQPTAYLGKLSGSRERWADFGIRLAPWGTFNGQRILVGGASDNYHRFSGLEEPNAYYPKLVNDIRQHTSKKIIYRPKPSYKGADKIPDTIHSGKNEHINDALKQAAVAVTHGSNLVFEATIAGVPTVVLGNGVGSDLCSNSLSEINKPKLASKEEREQWFSNIVQCQYSVLEIERGMAFEHALRVIALDFAPAPKPHGEA